jgi:hypothetical protein
MVAEPAPPVPVTPAPAAHVACTAPSLAVRETTPISPIVPAEPARKPAAPGPQAWDEPQVIERARKALASEPRRALALAQEHQRRFPSGALALEREVIVIEALARSGRSAEAKRRALAFESKYPQSIHLPRIRALRERLPP